MTVRDVTVVGGGMVGATTANLMARAGMSVTLLEGRDEPAWDADAPIGLRVSAFSPGSISVLERAGAWAAVNGRRHRSYRRMRVEDGQGSGVVEFEAARFGLERLGVIAENALVTRCLWDAFTGAPGLEVRSPAAVCAVRSTGDMVEAVLGDGATLTSRLLIACDGPRSAVRRFMGIGSQAWEYNQKAVVCTVEKSRPNPGTAWQRFLEGGPVALLPLPGGVSSLVWSVPARDAESLLAMDEAEFIHRLDEATSDWLGTVTGVGPRAAFPLAMNLSDRYIAGRVVLLGDAAHAIHPLAGQGVNLGLADAAALVETLVKQRAAGGSLAAPDALASFERWRRSESSLMAAGVHGLGALFRPGLLAPLRTLGMGVVGRSWLLRDAFIRRAAGLGPHAPRLALGVPLDELA